MKKIAMKCSGAIPVVSMLLLLLFFSSGKSISQVTIQAINTATGAATTVNSLTNVPAGALLVSVTSGEEDNTGNCSVSSSLSLTCTKKANAEVSSSGDAEIFRTAIYSTGGKLVKQRVNATVGVSTFPADMSALTPGYLFCKTSLQNQL